MLNNIVDGFTYDMSVAPANPGDTLALWLGQMDVIRRSRSYRAKWYIVPVEDKTPVPAYTTLEHQIRVAEGAYLWGFRYARNVALLGGVVPHLRITEQGTGIPLFDDFLAPGSAYTNQWFYTSAGFWPLTQMRLIVEPGFINIEFSNATSGGLTPQLVLYFAEPCLITATSEQCQLSNER